ncbi:iron chelate uptake ABC transporter family permease subunit [Curvibacter sp. CHRR-16]|uniref:iron chelate uptake ABC transporter family permease subunit n=1 Tax=Curvibacter sp. CHRR-16 TaxID=2835872 RepID=UPI001BDA4C31|nr:iron chelate uptake ABC transporter family permease subunit [Curvibacter sp. CHRR-16]
MWLWAALLLAAAVGLTLLGVCLGSTGWSAWPSDDLQWRIVTEIRLPRSLGAWAAGALLALSGAVAQGLFRNPLADPYLLGSASGAALAVALALAALGSGMGMLGQGNSVAMMGSPLAVSVFSSSLWLRLGLSGAAFVGAAGAALLTLALAGGAGQTLRLLLCGVVVGVVLGASTQVVLLATPDSLQAMQAFLLGSSAFLGWTSVQLLLVGWVLALLAALLLARGLDALGLGEATAHSLGLPLARLRWALVAIMAACTALAVAQTGLVAFVGLVAPHLVRLRWRGTHRGLLLLSSLVGGLLLLAADLGARSLLAPRELPLGVVTAVLGGGYLLWLLHRRGVGAGWHSGAGQA